MADPAPDTPRGSLEKHGMAVRSLFPELWDTPDEKEASKDSVEDETLSPAAAEKVYSTEERIDNVLYTDTAFSTDSSKVSQMRESWEKSTTTTSSQLLNLNDFHTQQRARRRGDLQKKKESLQGLHNFHSPPPQITPTKEPKKKLQHDSKAADRAAMASYMFLRQQTGSAKKESPKATGTASAKCKHGEGPAPGIPHGAARKWRPSPETTRQIIVTDVNEFYMQQHAIHLEDARKKREVLHISDRRILFPDRKSSSPRSYKKPTVDSFGIVGSAFLSSSHSMEDTMDRSFKEKVEDKLGSQGSLDAGTKLFLEAQCAGDQHAADEPGQLNGDSSITVQDNGDDEPSSLQRDDSFENTETFLENNAMAKEPGSPLKLVDECEKTASADDVSIDPDNREVSDSLNAMESVEQDGRELVPPPAEHDPDTSAHNDEPEEVLSEVSIDDRISGIGDEPVEDEEEERSIVVQLEASLDVATGDDEPIVASSVTNEDETNFGDSIEGESCKETEIKAASPTSTKETEFSVHQSTVTVAVTYPLLTQLSQESSEKIGLISKLLSDEPTDAMDKSIPGNPVTGTPLSDELGKDWVNLKTTEWSTTEESIQAEGRESLESKNGADSVDTKPEVNQREVSFELVTGAVTAENNAVAEEFEAPSKPAHESSEKLGSAEDDVVDLDIRKEPDSRNSTESINPLGDKVTPPPVERVPGPLARDEEPPKVLPPLSELLSDESISDCSTKQFKDQELGPPSKLACGSTENLALAHDLVVDLDTSEELDSHNVYESAKKDADSLAPPQVEDESGTMDLDEPPELRPSLSLLQTIERRSNFLDEPVKDKGEARLTTEQNEADCGDTEPKGDWREVIDMHVGSDVVVEDDDMFEELGPPLELEDESPEKLAPAEDVVAYPDRREEADSQSFTGVKHDGNEPTSVENDPGMLARNDDESTPKILPSFSHILTDKSINKVADEPVEDERETLVSTELLEVDSKNAGPEVDQQEALDEFVANNAIEKIDVVAEEPASSNPADESREKLVSAEDVGVDLYTREESDSHSLSKTNGEDGGKDTPSPMEHDPGTSPQNDETPKVFPTLSKALSDGTMDGLADEPVEDGETLIATEQLEGSIGDAVPAVDQREALVKLLANDAIEKIDEITKVLESSSKPDDTSPEILVSAEDVVVDPDTREESESHSLSKTYGEDGGKDTPSPVEHDPGTSPQNDETPKVFPTFSETMDKFADEPEEDGETLIATEQLEGVCGDAGPEVEQREVLGKFLAIDAIEKIDALAEVLESLSKSSDKSPEILVSAEIVGVDPDTREVYKSHSLIKTYGEDGGKNTPSPVEHDPGTSPQNDETPKVFPTLSKVLSDETMDGFADEPVCDGETLFATEQLEGSSGDARPAVDQRDMLDKHLANDAIEKIDAITKVLESSSKPSDESPEILVSAEDVGVDPDTREDSEGHSLSKTNGEGGGKDTPSPVEHDPGTSPQNDETPKVFSTFSETMDGFADEPVEDGETLIATEQLEGSIADAGPEVDQREVLDKLLANDAIEKFDAITKVLESLSRPADETPEILVSAEDVGVDPDNREECNSHSLIKTYGEDGGKDTPSPVEHDPGTSPQNDETPKVFPTFSKALSDETMDGLADEPIEDGETLIATEQLEGSIADAGPEVDQREVLDKLLANDAIEKFDAITKVLESLSRPADESPEILVSAEDVVDPDTREESNSHSSSKTNGEDGGKDTPSPVEHDPGTTPQNDETPKVFPTFSETMDRFADKPVCDGETLFATEQLEGSSGDARPAVDQRDMLDKHLANDAIEKIDAITKVLESSSKPSDESPEILVSAEDVGVDPDTREESNCHSLSKTNGEDGGKDTPLPVGHDPGTSPQNDGKPKVFPSLSETMDGFADEPVEDGETLIATEQLKGVCGDAGPEVDQREALEKLLANDAIEKIDAITKVLESSSKPSDESPEILVSAEDVGVDPDSREESDSHSLSKTNGEGGGKDTPSPVEHDPGTSPQNEETLKVFHALSKVLSDETMDGFADEPVEDGETLIATEQLEGVCGDAGPEVDQREVLNKLLAIDAIEKIDAITKVLESSSKPSDESPEILVSAEDVGVDPDTREECKNHSLIKTIEEDGGKDTPSPVEHDPGTSPQNDETPKVFPALSELLSDEIMDGLVDDPVEDGETMIATERLEGVCGDAGTEADQREVLDDNVAHEVIEEIDAVADELESSSKPAEKSPEILVTAEDVVVDLDTREESVSHNSCVTKRQDRDKDTLSPIKHDPGTSAQNRETSVVLPSLSELPTVASFDRLADEPVEEGAMRVTTNQLEEENGNAGFEVDQREVFDDLVANEDTEENDALAAELESSSNPADESPQKPRFAEEFVIDPDTRAQSDCHSLSETNEQGGDQDAPLVDHDPGALAQNDERPEVFPSFSELITDESTDGLKDEPANDQETPVTVEQLEGDSADAGPNADQREVPDDLITREKFVAKKDAVTEELGSLSKPSDQSPKTLEVAEDVVIGPDTMKELDSHNVSETKGQNGDEDAPPPVEHDPCASAQDESSEVLPSLSELLNNESIDIDDMADESVEDEGEVSVSPEHLAAGSEDVGCKIDRREVYDETVVGEVASERKESHADDVNEDRISAASEEDSSVHAGDFQDEDAEDQSDGMVAPDKCEDGRQRLPTPESPCFHSLRNGNENERSATTNEEQIDVEEIDDEDVNEILTEEKSFMPAVETLLDTVLGQDAAATAIVSTSVADTSDAADSENTTGEANPDEFITESAASSELNTDTDAPVVSILNDPYVNDQIASSVNKADKDDNDSQNAAAPDEKVMVTEQSVKIVNLPDIAHNNVSPALKGLSRLAGSLDLDALVTKELLADEPPLIILKERFGESPNLGTTELENEEEMSSNVDNQIENTSMDQEVKDTNKLVSDDDFLASAGKPANDECIEIVSSESQSHQSTDGDLVEKNVTEQDSYNICAPSTGSTDEAAEPVVEVDYKSRDYRGFVFVVHKTHGLMLLHCTGKKEEGPHFQLPGGHVEEHEFLAAAESSRDAQTQLMLAARAGAARELYKETGMDLRYQLDRLEPAALRSYITFDEHGTPTLKCELKHRLYFFLPVSDEDFWSTERGDSEAGRVHPLCAEGKHLMLKVSIEHSGWTLEKKPNKSVELLAIHSGGIGATALRMTMAREGTGAEELQSNNEQQSDVAEAEKENPQEAARAPTPVDLLSPPDTNILAKLFECCNWSLASDE